MWWIAGLFIVAYGLFAFDSGLKVSPAFNQDHDNAQKVQEIIDQANQGRKVDPSLVNDLVPELIALIAALESEKYAYSSESLLPQEHHYHSLPEDHRTALSTHMMLGLFVLATGFIQFVPAFRRRYRKAHRVIGLVYLGTAMSSMSLSAYYLLITDIDDIYNTFVFYVALWDLTVSTVACLVIATVYVLKRDFARHLGWQALGFSFLLSAPVQRFEWLLLSPFSNGLTFNEMNVVVNVVLWAQLCCIAYLLFCVNRAASSKDLIPLKGFQFNLISLPVKGLLLMALCMALILEAFVYGWSTGAQSLPWLSYAMTEPAVVAHDVIYDSGLTELVAICSSALVFFIARFLLSSREKPKLLPIEASLILGLGLLLATTYLYWGYQIGLPSNQKSVGGIFYAGLGGLMFLFSAYFGASWACRKKEYATESLIFLLFISCAPAIEFFMLGTASVFDIFPEKYRLLGHAYQGACTFALFLPLLSAFLIVIYSRHTNSYRIN